MSRCTSLDSFQVALDRLATGANGPVQAWLVGAAVKPGDVFHWCTGKIASHVKTQAMNKPSAIKVAASCRIVLPICVVSYVKLLSLFHTVEYVI